MRRRVVEAVKRPRRRPARPLRLVAVSLAVSMVLVLATPTDSQPTSGPAPWAPLLSWLAHTFTPAAAAETPAQQSGTAEGAPETVSADATDTTLVAGRSIPDVPGALPAFSHVTPARKAAGASQAREGDGYVAGQSDPVDGTATADQQVFANEDGTYTRTVSSGQVNYQDDSGAWTEIDTTLTTQKDGDLAPAASPVDVQLAPAADDPALVTVAPTDDTQVSFSLEGAATAAAKITGDTAVYADVLPDTDLHETPLSSGVKESIVLQSADAARTWRFPLTLDGLTARVTDDGTVELVDASGDVAAVVPHGVMSDASIDPVSGDHATSSKVAYEIETAADGAQTLVVTAADAWLDDPARVWPVTVDPTISTQPFSDTYVETGYTGPFNGSDEMKVGTYDSGTHKARSFLSFKGFATTYATAAISDVKLKLFMSWASYCDADTSFYVGQVSESWDPSTLASHPGPAIGGSTSSPVKIATWTGTPPSAACTNTTSDRSKGGWVTVDLPVDVFQGWAAGDPNYGLALFASEGSTTTSWKIFDTVNRSGLEPYLQVTYTKNVKPQVTKRYPTNEYAATTLTPELIAYGQDKDAAPKALSYVFNVYSSATSTTPLATSGKITDGDWQVPSGTLSWAGSYYWTVQAYDGLAYSSTSPRRYLLTTPVPQPPITSNLSQNSDDHGYDESVGNYTTSASDADLDTVGPSLSVDRSFNSLDPRTAGAFGAGWSSLYDMKVTQATSADGAVTATVTYPTGEDVAFGKNADGTYTPPSGHVARFVAVTGGFTLTDAEGTIYTFTQAVSTSVYGLTKIDDGDGRTETFTYTSGQLSQVTSASGRYLTFAWSTPSGATAAHVTSVTTSPATAGTASSALTWTYGYSGDTLTSACAPASTTACTTYAYTALTPYPTTVLDLGPRTYLRLGESGTATTAVSEIRANGGSDNGDLNAVTLGQTGGLTGSTATAAGFDGTTSNVELTAQPRLGRAYQSLSLRFKTTTASGVLFSYSGDELAAGGTTTGNYTPGLYIDSAGRLEGGFWTGSSTTTLTSTNAVTDGAWHEVVLTGSGSTQSLFLDGALMGTRTGDIKLYSSNGAAHVYVGAGYIGGKWPNQAHYSTTSSTGYATYFKGSISDVAFFDSALRTSDVSRVWAASKATVPAMTSTTSPSGHVYATVTYTSATARVAKVVDENGTATTLGTPQPVGMSDVYASSVLGQRPRDYWRFAEESGPDAVNELLGDTLTYTGSSDTSVVLNDGTGPFHDTVATFDGTGYADAQSTVVSDGGDKSISLWFKTTSTTGVLAGYQAGQISDGTVSANYTPLLYLDTSGYLRGEWFVPGGGSSTPLKSAAKLNDGKWHFVVLSAAPTASKTQTLYVDGAAQGTLAGAVALSTSTASAHFQIGSGFIGGPWPGYPTSYTAPTATFYQGAIGDVAYYRHELTATQVAGQWAAVAQVAKGSTGVQVDVTETSSIAAADGTYPTHTSSTVFDAANGLRPVSQTNAVGDTTTFGYDTGGFFSTVVDPRGAMTINQSDTHGNVLAATTCQDQTNSVCSTVLYTYYYNDADPLDPRNNELLTMSDGRSTSADDARYRTTYAYDAKGHRLSTTSPPVSVKGSTTLTSPVTSTSYTDGTSIAAADSGYAPAGLPYQITSAGGYVTTYTYFANGDVAKVTNESGLVTSFTYDGVGRVVTSTETSDTYPAGLTTTTTYDKNSQPLTETAPSVVNRVTGATHTARTTSTYDADGNVTSQTVSDTTGGDASRTTSSTYDAYGRVKTATDELGAVTSYEYDGFGNLAADVDPDGTRTEYTYDAENRPLTTVLKKYTGSDPANPQTAHDLVQSARTYDPAGRVAMVTDAMGRRTQYTYTDDGLVSTVTSLAPVGVSGDPFVTEANSYDAAGNLIKRVSNNGATVEDYSVDAAGRTTKITVDASGVNRSTSYTFTAEGEADTTTSADGTGAKAVVTAGYNSHGQLVSSTSSGSVGSTARTTTWTLDQRGLTTSVTDPLGKVTNYDYDEAEQLAATTQPAVAVESAGGTAVTARPFSQTGYNTYGDVTETRDANGNVATSTYDALGHVVAQTGTPYTPPGATAAITPQLTFAYDTSGQLIKQTDALGKSSTFTYDQNGDQVSTTDAAGNVSTAAYDDDGELLTQTDPLGAVSKATYDHLGRKATSTQVVRQPTTTAAVTTYAYSTSGSLASVKSPLGVTTTYTNNALGETTGVKDAAGNSTTYTYDFAGRVTRTKQADSTYSDTVYDDFGNTTATKDYDASGTLLRSRSATYDANDHLLTSTDARGNTTTFTYDAAGSVTGESQPVASTDSGATGSAIVTSFGYDAAGNQTRFTDGRGNAFITTYNSMGLPESQIEPATTAYSAAADRTFTAVYDANGQLVKSTLPGGVSVTNTYDDLGQLTGSTGTGADAATVARVFGYDAAGHMTSVSAGTGSDALTYDDRGLLLSTTGPSGASSFAYNADGLMTTRTDAAGTSTYGYDTADRLSTVADPLTATTATYSYNTLSQPTKITYGTGTVRNFTYDSLHRLASDKLTTAAGAAISGVSYGYDREDDLTSKTTTGVTGASVNSYGYDGAGRLISWGNGTTTTAYGYDASGNRTKAGSTTYSYDQRNQLTADGTRTYQYSARGTLSSITTTASGSKASSTFDAFGQAVTQSGRTYAYDGLGRVLSASGAGSSSTMAYSGASNSLASDGTSVFTRDPGEGLVAERSSATGTSVWAWVDQHQDVVGQFTTAGTSLSGSATYDPWGTVTGSSGLVGSLGYQSGWTDSSTGRVDMLTRWYDPSLGQFISRDSASGSPVPTSVSANRFAYVVDNPLVGTDESGQCSWWDAGCRARAAMSKVASAAVRVVSHYAVAAASHVYYAARSAARATVRYTKKAVHKLAHKVHDSYHKLRKVYHHYVRKIRHYAARVVRKAVHQMRQVARQVKTAVKHPGATLKKAAKATAKFAKRHAGAIAGAVAGVVAFAGCEAALGAATAGAGAVAGAAVCGAVAGAAASAMTNLVDVAAGNKKFSLKSLVKDTVMGAVTGALAGGLGVVGGRAISALMNTPVGRSMAAAGERLAGSAVGRVAGSALGLVGRAQEALEAPARAFGSRVGASARSVLSRGASSAESEVGAVAGGAARAESEAKAGAGEARSCPFPRNSFAAGTLVVMADGSLKAIEKIRLGDVVLATDPVTGVSAGKSVSVLFDHLDTDLADVKVTTTRASGRKTTAKAGAKTKAGARATAGVMAGSGAKSSSGVVRATAGHPFWDATTGSWVRAADLSAGDVLYTGPSVAGVSLSAVVASVHTWTGRVHRYNLTVDDIHTYYVIAANTPVLVHNCGDNVYEVPDEGVKHGTRNVNSGRGDNSAEPLDGQAALDNSVQIKPTSERRVGISEGQIVILDRTLTRACGCTVPGGETNVFHGHVRSDFAKSEGMSKARTALSRAIKNGIITP